MFTFQNDYFSHKIKRIVSDKWSWISRNGERFFFIKGLYSKMSFFFYTGIIFWENVKDLHGVLFHKFTSLLSKSSVSEEDSKDMEVNLEKRRHGFWQEHVQLEKNLLDFTQLSPLEICRRDFVVTVSIFRVQLGFEFKVR